MTETKTRRQLGPDDAGVQLTDEEYEAALYEPGYRYELVAGRLYVTPAPNAPHMFIVELLSDHLKRYAWSNPGVIQWVTSHARVITRERGGTTNVEPDISTYVHVPTNRTTTHWRDLQPLVVVEVVSDTDPRKDLVRNRGLYLAVPSVQEYWIVDPRVEPTQPTLLALVRGPDGWLERPIPAGSVYRTDLLPGLEVDLAALLRT